MTRPMIALATALLAAPALLTSAAEACISCDYVPPVVNTPVYSHGSHRAYAPSPRRIYRAVKAHEPRAAKKRTVEREPARESKKVQAAAVERAEEPAKEAADSQNSSIAVAKADVAEKGDAARETKAASETAAPASDCKKFFPSVGMTLTVPCE